MPIIFDPKLVISVTSHELSAYVYAITAKLEVNLAQVIVDNLVEEYTILFLPYGACLTHVFKIFKVNISTESNVVKTFEEFDYSILYRMKLLNDPPTQPTTSSKKFHPSKESQTFTQNFDDAYYNTLFAQVLNFTTGQEKLYDQQVVSLKNQNEIMDHLQSLTIKMDAMYGLMMDMSQFPPPPPTPLWIQCMMSRWMLCMCMFSAFSFKLCFV